MFEEVWKDIPGFEGAYQASDRGRIRALDRMVSQRNRWGKVMLRFQKGRIMRPSLDKDGYVRVSNCCLPTPAVHRLVAMTFITNPLNLPQVNHKNGDVADNHVDNLEWCTNSYNHLHAYGVLGRTATRHGMKETVIISPDNEILVFPDAIAASVHLGVGRTAVYNAAKSKYKCKGFEVRYV